MSIELTQLHFLRPEWLWALIPCTLLCWVLFRQKRQAMQWQQLIDPELLEPMTQAIAVEPQPRQQRFGLYSLLLGWSLSIVALAGPSWEQLPVPASTNANALIIALDLSYSMLAEDVKPSRIERVKYKINDILDHRAEGYTALIAYAGDAHVVSPLTQDTNTIRNLVNPLSPLIMPAPGSRPDKAIELAETLRAQAGLPKARVLLITDDIIEADITRIKKLPLEATQLSLLAVGSAAGAPINIPNRGFLRNKAGELILPTLNYALVEQLADETRARVAQLNVSDSDWRHLIPEDIQYTQPHYQQQDQQQNQPQRQKIDQWRDAGVWLVLGLLPFAALSFRKGWIFAFTLAWLLPLPQPSMAFEWQDLWQTPDQQAQALYPQDPKAAASKFNNSEWQAMAHYKAGEYQQAIDILKPIEKADSAFNLGNAYAKTQQLKEAIAAYQQALALKSPFPEAQENLEYVTAMLKQQENQQQQNQQQGKPENADKQTSASDHQQNQQGQNGSGNQSSSEQGASTQSQDAQSQGAQSQGSQSNNTQNQNQNAQNTDQQGQNSAADPSTQQASETSTNNSAQADSSAHDDINDALAGESQQTQEALDDLSAPDLRAMDAAQAKAEQDSQEEPQTETAQAIANPTEQDTQSEQERANTLAGATDLEKSLDPEQYQALQQWLNRVPEDPSGLLERKFLYEYKKRQRQQAEQESKAW